MARSKNQHLIGPASRSLLLWVCVICPVGNAVSQEVALLEAHVVDLAHGAQSIHGEAPVIVGLPAHLTGRLDFQLAPGTVLPRGGLDVLWRSLNPSGEGISIYAEETAEGGYLPREWYAQPDGSPITVVRYNEQTGLGSGRLDLPLGRARDFELYPPLHMNQATVELVVGLSGELEFDTASQTISGSRFSSTVSFETTTPEFVVDIFRPRSSPGEALAASIQCTQLSSAPRTLELACTVSGVITGLPTQVTLAAGASNEIVAYAPLVEGAYQIEVYESGALVGYSTTAIIDSDADRGYNGLAEIPLSANHGQGGLVGIAPELYTTTIEPEDFTYPFAVAAASPSPHYDYEYENFCLKPARPYVGRNAGDLCGSCALTPLTEEDKPDCPVTTPLFWLHICDVRLVYLGQASTQCQVTETTAALNIFQWTGSRGEYKCAGAELSIGQVIGAAIGFDRAKSCCTYRNTGETGMFTFPTCTPN